MWFDSYPDEKEHVSVAPLPTTGLGPAMALLSAMPECWGRVRVPVPATPVSLSAAIVEFDNYIASVFAKNIFQQCCRFLWQYK